MIGIFLFLTVIKIKETYSAQRTTFNSLAILIKSI